MFLSRAVAAEAVRARPRRHLRLPRGLRLRARGRRATSSGTAGRGPCPAELASGSYDAVVDVARHPSYVRHAVEAFPDAHWIFVSTINVYSDDTIPNGTPDTLPLREPVHTDEDPRAPPRLYGAMKVSCEQAGARGRGLGDGGPARA